MELKEIPRNGDEGKRSSSPVRVERNPGEWRWLLWRWLSRAELGKCSEKEELGWENQVEFLREREGGVSSDTGAGGGRSRAGLEEQRERRSCWAGIGRGKGMGGKSAARVGHR